jgi:O-antigen ligase
MRAVDTVPLPTILLKKPPNPRLAIVCMAAASVGLSMALISTAKLLLVLCGLTALLFSWRRRAAVSALPNMRTPVIVLLAIFVFALSLLWAAAPQSEALGAVAKYGKLLVIVIMVLLIRNRREALYALAAFAAAQLFLLLSSWMLFARLPVPWATSNMALTHYAVFSSYLDQGIMSAVFAALCWHLRGMVPGKFGSTLAITVALLALGNVFFLLPGRTGHLVAVALLSIAVMWELPGRYRLAAALMPFALIAALAFGSPAVHERIMQVKTELQTFSFQEGADIVAAGGVSNSASIRLHFWHRALQSIRDNPWVGSGAGSWATEYNRLEQRDKETYNAVKGGNPHQEYLLWGVQLGIPGILLLCTLMLSILKDTTKMLPPYARATQSVLLGLAIACAFNASLYDALIGDFFCVLIGLLLALGYRTASDSAAVQAGGDPA